MRITVSNNREITDKHIPQGSGKANAKKILARVESQVTNTSIPKPDVVQPKYVSPIRHQSASRNRAPSSGKQRAESSGRAKQAGWREAQGPPEKGIGFKGKRKGKSGLAQWKAFLAQPTNGTNVVSASTSENAKANELKAMLGVIPSPASNLKAMLGVDPTKSAPMPVPPQASAPKPNNSTVSLKAALGVVTGVAPTAIPPPPSPCQPVNNGFPPPPPVPPSAADQLLQMMAQQQQQRPMAQIPVPAIHGGSSSFNFSYTVEGEDESEQQPPRIVPQPPQGMPMGYPPQPPAGMPMMAPYGYMPQSMPPPVMGHPGMPLATMPMMAQQLPHVVPVANGESKPPMASTTPRAPPAAEPSTVISDTEFPPLGASPPAKKEQDSDAETGDTPVAPEEKSSKPKPAPRSFLVPSSVKAGKK
mmetsp:Transcript_10342/g.24193  ORF Transcript_10342/g.24193 Transcript_10342/m.24193 type:complete len:417 (+) Transcript_10342:91-1341(+)